MTVVGTALPLMCDTRMGHAHMGEACACAQRVRDALVQERQRLYSELQGIPFLEPYPSEANFILCKVVGGHDAKAVKDALAAEHGIMVRHYAKAELSGYIRISVGLPQHTDAIAAALQKLAQLVPAC